MSLRERKKKRIASRDTRALTEEAVPEDMTIVASDVHQAHQEVVQVETTASVVRAATIVDMAVAPAMNLEAVIPVEGIDLIAQVGIEGHKGIESHKKYN